MLNKYQSKEAIEIKTRSGRPRKPSDKTVHLQGRKIKQNSHDCRGAAGRISWHRSGGWWTNRVNIQQASGENLICNLNLKVSIWNLQSNIWINLSFYEKSWSCALWLQSPKLCLGNKRSRVDEKRTAQQLFSTGLEMCWFGVEFAGRTARTEGNNGFCYISADSGCSLRREWKETGFYNRTMIQRRPQNAILTNSTQAEAFVTALTWTSLEICR